MIVINDRGFNDGRGLYLCVYGSHADSTNVHGSHMMVGVSIVVVVIWIKQGKNSTSGKYFEFYKYLKKRNADAAKVLLEKLNDSAKAGDTRICMFILERRFSEDFGRRVYRKTNFVSQNLNQNVEIIVQDTDAIRKEILAKLDRLKKVMSL